jgi:hypothetical protein
MRYILTLLFCASAFGADIGELSSQHAELSGRWLVSGTYNTSTVQDLSGRKNIGTAINNPAPVTTGIRPALRFNGTNQYVDFGTTANNQSSNSFTVAFWFRTSSAATMAVLGKRDASSSSNPGFLSYVLSGNVRFEISSGGTRIVAVTTTTYNDNRWHHACGVFDRLSLLLVYVDGELQATADITGQSGSVTTAAKSLLGAAINSGAPAAFFNGELDDARIYKRALSATEAAALYKKGLR